MSPEAILFESDSVWLEWAEANSGGFVLNVRVWNDPEYVVLHRASCSLIVGVRATGAYTERSYGKVGAANIEALRQWVVTHRRPDGRFTKRCGRCNP